MSKLPSPAEASMPTSSTQPLTASASTPLSVYDMMINKQPLSSRLFSPEVALHRPIPIAHDERPYSVENITRRALPYFTPYSLAAVPRHQPPDFSWISESCGGKTVIGVIGGGAMGLLMGVFLGAMSDATPPVTVIAGKDVPTAPFREQMRVVLRATGEKSMYWCRNFAFITGVFGGSECLVEKYRGKHDVWNSVTSGCITGAALQAKSGPHAMAVGCGGFAAFSFAIDSFMGH